MSLPDVWKMHTVTAEPLDGTGTGAFGDVFAAPVPLEGFLEYKRRTVRDENGDEVVSESTFYTDPGPILPPRSRVTLPDGNVTRVIAAADLDGGDTPLPSHLALNLE